MTWSATAQALNKDSRFVEDRRFHVNADPNAGAIAAINRDGFVTIKDRAKRWRHTRRLPGLCASKGASDLMVTADVIIVDKLLLLGFGKPDLTAVARLVATRESAAAE